MSGAPRKRQAGTTPQRSPRFPLLPWLALAILDALGSYLLSSRPAASSPQHGLVRVRGRSAGALADEQSHVALSGRVLQGGGGLAEARVCAAHVRRDAYSGGSSPCTSSDAQGNYVFA